jgi:hypothetical protein
MASTPSTAGPWTSSQCIASVGVLPASTFAASIRFSAASRRCSAQPQA